MNQRLQILITHGNVFPEREEGGGGMTKITNLEQNGMAAYLSASNHMFGFRPVQ